jgi:tubulin-specific chaperone A
MNTETKRNLKIKTGIVRRTVKELESYQKEVALDQERIEKFKKTDRSEHSVKKQEQVLSETISMIPETRRRLNKALEGLEEIINQNVNLEQSEDWISALQVLSKGREISSY